MKNPDFTSPRVLANAAPYGNINTSGIDRSRRAETDGGGSVFRERKRTAVRTAVVMAVAAATMVLCAALYMRSVTGTLREETLSGLREVARQSAGNIAMRIEKDMQMLEAVSRFVGAQPELDIDGVTRVLCEEVESTSFKRMGLITPDGTAHTTDSVEMDLGGRGYFLRAMDGETVISKELTDYADGEPIYVYATPILRGGRAEAVLFATNAADAFASVINVRMFEGAGYSYLTNAGGDVLVYPDNPESEQGMSNIFDRMEEGRMLPDEELGRMRRRMSSGDSGVEEYFRDGERRYLSYTPIGVNGWYVLSAVSGHVAARKSVYLTMLTLVVCVVTVTVLIGLFGYILFMQNSRRRELERIAFTDPVTGGYNWNGFIRAAREVVGGAAEYVMVSFDIDKFKVFNDMFGHGTGNELLGQIWGILSRSVREGELFARVSADTFDLLLRAAPDEEIVRRLTEIGGQINPPGQRYTLTLSFGVYRVGPQETDVSLMSDRASIARKSGKDDSRTTVAFYDHAVRDRILREKQIEDAMASALEKGEFEVYLQPKYSASTREIVGAESLVRWNRPGVGLVPPNDFIPLFERDGFVVQIDAFVLRETCRMLRGWADEGLPEIPVSVNVSRVNLHDPGFVGKVCAAAREYGVPPGLIELEITETSVLDFENIGRLTGIIGELHDAGFLVSMDDFGSGYSSLNLLRRLPVDVLKLDRAFFAGDADNARGRMVIAEVADLARKLDIQVVAEGVETAGQVDFLTSIGCDVVQGYYFARPMPAGEFERLRRPQNKND